jgi:hypothetical protein
MRLWHKQSGCSLKMDPSAVATQLERHEIRRAILKKLQVEIRQQRHSEGKDEICGSLKKDFTSSK